MTLHSLRSWLRVVLPVDQLAYLALLVVLGLAAMETAGPWHGNSTFANNCRAWHHVIVIVSALFYAGFRAAYFHPVENRRYGTWLANSPWRYPQRLPLGPLHLVWQDLLVVCVLTVLMPSDLFSRLIIPIGFLLVFCLALTYGFVRVGIYWPLYANAMLVGGFILAVPSITEMLAIDDRQFAFGLPAHSAWACLGIAGLMYAVTYSAVQQLLARFPFTTEKQERLRLAPTCGDPMLAVGWPVPPTLVERYKWRIGHLDAALVGVCAGWLMFCISVRFVPPGGRETQELLRDFLVTITLVALGARAMVYIVGYIPPISLLGRIAKFRLVIPGYDIVFAPLIVVAAVAYWLPDAAMALGWPAILAYPMTAVVVVWLTLALPPRREDWIYTGHHRVAYRVRAAFSDRSNKSQVRGRT